MSHSTYVLALEVPVLVALLLIALVIVVEAGALVALVVPALVVMAGRVVVDEGSYKISEASAVASEETEVALSAAP